jgi:hypothetical protein
MIEWIKDTYPDVFEQSIRVVTVEERRWLLFRAASIVERSHDTGICYALSTLDWPNWRARYRSHQANIWQGSNWAWGLRSRPIRLSFHSARVHGSSLWLDVANLFWYYPPIQPNTTIEQPTS